MRAPVQLRPPAALPVFPARPRAHRHACRVTASATEDGPITKAVNWLSVAVKNSPANAVKQASISV